jgi:DUF2934 family protein
MNSITVSDLAKAKPTEAIVEREIQIRAYELYEERGKGPGFALEDWVRAENEVLEKCHWPGVAHKLASQRRSDGV